MRNTDRTSIYSYSYKKVFHSSIICFDFQNTQQFVGCTTIREITETFTLSNSR